MAEILTLYDLCMNHTAELLRNAVWNLNYDIQDNPFSALPSSVVDELIIYVTRSSVASSIKCSDLHPLLTSGRVRNFKLEDVSVPTEDLEAILTDLTSFCENLISLKLKNVFTSSTYRNSSKTYALEELLLRASKLEYLESCIEFNLSVLCNCANLKQLILNFPVKDHLFDFLEIDGQMMPHNSLKVLEVFEDVRHPISYIDVAVILRYCTELVEINCDVSKSLEYLHTEKLLNGTLATLYKLEKCCLGSIYLDAADATVSKDGVYITSLTCPYLTEVDVLVKDYAIIHALRDFQNLTSLLIQWETMNDGDYHEGIQPLLKNSEFGHKLKSLHIMNFSKVDFSSIGDCCSNLEELRVEFLSETNRFEFPPTSFQKLINLHVENIFENDCQERSLVGLLSNSTNLRYLTILPAGMLTDSVLAKILHSNNLNRVKELRVSNCSLSVQGLRNLATSLTSLDYFEMSSSAMNLDVAATIIHEINPRIILSATVNQIGHEI